MPLRSTESDMGACCCWLPWEPEEHGEIAALFASAYQNNVRRHAEALGPALIARLFRAGLLGPNGDPVEALEDLIDAANRAGRDDHA